MSGHPDFFPTQDKEVIVPDGGGEPFERYGAYPPGAIAEVELSFATVQPVAQVPMEQQQQAGNYPISQQHQDVPHVEQPFAGSAQVGHLPQQSPQSQPQQVSLPPQFGTSQTSQPDHSTTPAKMAPQFQQDSAGKRYSITRLSE